MPRSRRRKIVLSLLIAFGVVLTLLVVLIVVVLIVVKSSDHPAKIPPGYVAPTTLPSGGTALPAGKILFDSDRGGQFQLYSMDTDGSNVTALTSDPTTDAWWPRLSPDRQTILFYRTPAGTHDRDFAKTSLWAINSSGGDAKELRPAGTDGWTFQGHAEWSPDGAHLVMFGGSRLNPQIYTTTSLGTDPTALTKRGGTNIDPSYSPDGRTVVFVGCPNSFCQADDYEIYTVPSGGGSVTRLTHDGLRDNDPYYSPDGRQLAWLTQINSSGALGVWDIRIAGADGQSPRRLVGDDAVNSKPQWSADGKLIYFHRVAAGGTTFEVFSIRPDGSGLTEITQGQPGNNEYPNV